MGSGRGAGFGVVGRLDEVVLDMADTGWGDEIFGGGLVLARRAYAGFAKGTVSGLAPGV